MLTFQQCVRKIIQNCLYKENYCAKNDLTISNKINTNSEQIFFVFFNDLILQTGKKKTTMLNLKNEAMSDCMVFQALNKLTFKNKKLF